MVLQVAVDVQRLVELGKTYPWPRLTRCLSCNSYRIWGHGYVLRYFEGLSLPAWIRRLRCPDCGTVYTLRPDAFARGFRYSVATIISSLARTTTGTSLLPRPSRQARQYWLRALKFQASRTGNVLKPDVNTLYALLSRDVIPFTRSINRAILRL